MKLAAIPRIFIVAAVLALSALSAPAWAQDDDDNISASHLKAAYDAIGAIKATDPYDAVLPQAASALKNELIQKNPDLVDLIDSVVDKNALALASRRGDLEKEAAKAYARVFSEDELNKIAAFYNSPTGKKLLSDGPIVTREVVKAEQIWQNGIARDLSESSGKDIAAAVNAKAGATPEKSDGSDTTKK